MPLFYRSLMTIACCLFLAASLSRLSAQSATFNASASAWVSNNFPATVSDSVSGTQRVAISVSDYAPDFDQASRASGVVTREGNRVLASLDAYSKASGEARVGVSCLVTNRAIFKSSTFDTQEAINVLATAAIFGAETHAHGLGDMFAQIIIPERWPPCGPLEPVPFAGFESGTSPINYVNQCSMGTQVGSEVPVIANFGVTAWARTPVWLFLDGPRVTNSTINLSITFSVYVDVMEEGVRAYDESGQALASPPRLTITRSENSLTISMWGQTPGDYLLECSRNLKKWKPWATRHIDWGGTVTVTQPPTSRDLFFRCSLKPLEHERQMLKEINPH